MNNYFKPLLLFISVATAPTLLWQPSASYAQDVHGDEIIGTWSTADGNLVIEMYDAGETYAARFVHGNLIVQADGKTLMNDEKNPDPALRSRSLADVDFVSGLVWDPRDRRWEDGTIYQASAGRTGSARATIDGNALNLRAYRGTPIAGRTLVFERK